MKRILQIAASLRIGGAEKVARDLGYYAALNGYETDYIVFGDDVGDYEQELIDCGCKIYHLSEPSASYPKYLSSLKQLIRENHYDVVHAHTMFSIGWTMLAAKQCGVPVRVAHAHSALDNGSGIKKRVYEEIMRFLFLKYATDLVACGEAAGIRLFGEQAYRKEGKLILNGIDTQRFSYNPLARQQIREKLHLQDAFVIGHAGHLMEVKNQSYLIHLLPAILEQKPNAKLVLLGEGNDRPMLEKHIHDLMLEDSVIMTGNVRNVQDYLSAMDVFAFPSLYEGMPLSIVEVQANGLPCILSTGVPKDVYLTDLIFPLSLDQPEKWVDAILAAQRKNPERYAAQLRDQGFDTMSAMKKIYSIYES